MSETRSGCNARKTSQTHLIKLGENQLPSDYYLDLSEFSLEKLKTLFENTRLLPSQQILRVDIEARFACLEQSGIENLQQLQIALKTKSYV